MLVGESESLLSELVFARQRSAEQRWVVGVKRDHNSLVEIVFRGMVGHGLADASAQVAGDAQFDRNLTLGELFDQVGVLAGGKGVANALGAQVERSPYRFRRSGLAGVRGQAQAVVGGVGVDATEKFRRSFHFVTANTDADDVAILIAHRKFENFLRFFHAEVARGVEDPEQGDAEVACAVGTPALHAFENGGEILLAEQAHAHCHIDLGMQHVLFLEPLHEPVGDQLEIVRTAQVGADCFERHQETLEIGVGVERLNLAQRSVLAVPRLRSSSNVVGSTAPSRCRCSSALGNWRMKAFGWRSGTEVISFIVDSAGGICEERRPSFLWFLEYNPMSFTGPRGSG